MNISIRQLSLIICLLLSYGPLPSTSGAQQARKTPTLVCVVNRGEGGEPQNNMDAVVLIENGKLKEPYAEYNEAAQKKFASEYFRAGTKYRVTFGGGEVGSATVKGSDRGCNNIHATATVADNGKIPAHLSALATNGTSLGTKPSSRRAPTDAERAAAMKLVNDIYRAHQTPQSWLRLLKTTNLTATDLDGDGRFELIGSFVIETKSKARRDLLLIAEPQGETYKAALAKFQTYKLPPEEFDSAIDFVDQLDIDGDGIAEVFVTQHGFDAYGFAIYKKRNGRWLEIYTTQGDAC
jgi:hypothetical protein